MKAASLIENRLAMKNCTEDYILHKVFYLHKPDVQHILMFGSRDYVYKPTSKRDGKLVRRVKQCMLVGYWKTNSNSIFVISSNRVFESRKATFGARFEIFAHKKNWV